MGAKWDRRDIIIAVQYWAALAVLAVVVLRNWMFDRMDTSLRHSAGSSLR